jgi:hypothetical protein
MSDRLSGAFAPDQGSLVSRTARFVLSENQQKC